eukprot:m.165625 g.165625  ORF g.165625 m.165625 type:complete len:774 (+) comp16427_c2_seq2:174-2495(+)
MLARLQRFSAFVWSIFGVRTRRSHLYARCFLLTFLAHAAVQLLQKPFGIIKNDLAQNMAVSLPRMGWLDVSLLLPFAVVQVFMRKYVDKLGPRKVIGVSLIVASTCMVTFGWWNSHTAYALLLLLSGSFQSVVMPACVKALSTWHSGRGQTTQLGVWGSSLFAGQLLGTATAVWFRGIWGWRHVFVVPSLLAAFVGTLVLRLLRMPSSTTFITPVQSTRSYGPAISRRSSSPVSLPSPHRSPRSPSSSPPPPLAKLGRQGALTSAGSHHSAPPVSQAYHHSQIPTFLPHHTLHTTHSSHTFSGMNTTASHNNERVTLSAPTAHPYTSSSLGSFSSSHPSLTPPASPTHATTLHQGIPAIATISPAPTTLGMGPTSSAQPSLATSTMSMSSQAVPLGSATTLGPATSLSGKPQQHGNPPVLPFGQSASSAVQNTTPTAYLGSSSLQGPHGMVLSSRSGAGGGHVTAQLVSKPHASSAVHFPVQEAVMGKAHSSAVSGHGQVSSQQLDANEGTKFTSSLSSAAPAVVRKLLLKADGFLSGDHGASTDEESESETEAYFLESLQRSHELTLLQVLKLPYLQALGVTYFAVNMIRYAIHMWLPFYFQSQHEYNRLEAGYMSSVFDVGALMGSLLIGLVGDRLLGGRKILTCQLALVIGALATVMFHQTSSSGLFFQVIFQLVMGACYGGVDVLVSTSVAIAVGMEVDAVTPVVSVISCFGTFGAVLQAPLVALLIRHHGAVGGFYLMTALVTLPVISSVLARPVDNRLSKNKDDRVV